MSVEYMLGIDFGGGASKATLLSGKGKVIATTAKEYPTYYPQNGWAEQDPDLVYQVFISNVRDILSNSGVDPRDIKALCLDAATHNAVLLDEKGSVIRNAIYWTDKRSIKQSDFLTQNYYDLILEQTYNVPGPFWTLPQLMWIRENEPENFGRINKILFFKDYIRFRLTNEAVTDSIDAMGSMFLDARKNSWSPELCKLAGIRLDQLPDIVPPSAIIGEISPEASKETGLSQGTAIVAGATDTAMEVYASGCISPGQASVKLATAGRICVITEKEYPHPMLVTYRHLKDGLWYPGTATKSCAASFRWFRDVFGDHETELASKTGDDPYVLLDKMAGLVSPGSDNLFFHPYLQGEISPYLDNALKGSFTGVSAFHSKAHFTRAVLEGVAYSLLDSYSVLESLGLEMQVASIIGGGSNSKLWRQIVSDMFGKEMKKMQNDDSSFGSAMFAGVATGIFSSFEESVDRCISVQEVIKPDYKRHKVYEKNFAVYKKIHDALAPVYKEMDS